MGKGIQISDLSGLENAALSRCAVVCARWPKPRAAVFVFNMTGPIIASLLREGLFVYHRETPVKIPLIKRKGPVFKRKPKNTQPPSAPADCL